MNRTHSLVPCSIALAILIIAAAALPAAAQAQVEVVLAADGIDEANETAVLTLSAPDYGSLGSPSAHTLTITDGDDAPSVAFAAASSSGTESSSPTNAVELSAASSQTVTVELYLAGGTATQGSDFTITLGTLEFDPGETSIPLGLTIIDDALAHEGSETVVLGLRNAVNATLGTPAQSTLTITDNDTTVMSFTQTTSQAAEGQTVLITVELDKVSAVDVTADLSYSGTATQGDDYTGPDSITIPAGEKKATLTLKKE